MKKTGILVIVLSLTMLISSLAIGQEITRSNWTQKVGFAPDLNGVPFKAGATIDASNAGQAADFLPKAIFTLVTKYNMVIDVVDYKPIIPSDGYIAATNAQIGKAKITDTGSKSRVNGISDYNAGLPVLQPKTGLEVAYNYHFGYNGDDAKNHFGVYWVSAKNGVERNEEWLWNYIIRASHRTDVPPKPAITAMANKEIQYASLTVTLAPFDKKGFSALYYRYDDPKDQEGWIYLPEQRRTTRFTFGTRGDAWNNTDMLYEDVRGYMGYPEWMHWKILKKATIYAPMHAGVKMGKDNINKTWDFENQPHWNPRLNWEPRPVYVVEAKPKFSDYPYSKMICYIDAETYSMIFKECYDKKGQLWKVIMNILNDSPNPKTMPSAIAGALAVDFQSEHATTFCWYTGSANVGMKYNDFLPTVLRKYGK